MKKKFIEIIWNQPPVPTRQRFDVDKFKVTTDGGLVKVVDLEKKEIACIMPAHVVHLIQFGEEEVESPIHLATVNPEIPKNVVDRFVKGVS